MTETRNASPDTLGVVLLKGEARTVARRIMAKNFDLLAPDLEPSEQREFEDSITNGILAMTGNLSDRPVGIGKADETLNPPVNDCGEREPFAYYYEIGQNDGSGDFRSGLKLVGSADLYAPGEEIRKTYLFKSADREAVRAALLEVRADLERIARISEWPTDIATVQEAKEWAHAAAVVAMCRPKFRAALYAAPSPKGKTDGEAVAPGGSHLWWTAKALLDNINEFGTVTDDVFLDALDKALAAALSNPAQALGESGQ